MHRVLSEEIPKLTASGIVYTGKCIFRGFLLGCDGVNDPVVTVYNGLDNTGKEIVPTSTYDASAYGLNGCVGMEKYCSRGVYIEITCAGNVEVCPEVAPYYPDGILKWKG